MVFYTRKNANETGKGATGGAAPCVRGSVVRRATPLVPVSDMVRNSAGATAGVIGCLVRADNRKLRNTAAEGGTLRGTFWKERMPPNVGSDCVYSE